MANKVYNMEGGLHSAAAYSAFEDALYGSCVASESDYVCTAGTGMTVQLTAGQGLISTGTGYARRIGSDSTNTVTVSAASTANPRIDAIVAYIDNSVTPTTSVVDNTNDILKFKAVAGSPAASPVAPSAATIQSSVGAGNPYMTLWTVRVPANATSLATATFTDVRTFAKVEIGDGSITTNKLANGAVTAAKLDPNATGMVYLGETVLTATADRISFTASTTYSNYKILAGAVLATGSSAWLDVRMLNGSSTITNTHQVQRVDGTTWGSAINSGVTYLINSLGVNQYDGIDAEVDIYGGGSFWKKFHAYLGKAQDGSIITNISNGRNNSATAPDTFMLITGGTFSVGSWIKVWGWNNS